MRISGCLGITILVISLFLAPVNVKGLTVTPAAISLDKSEYSVGEQPFVTVEDNYSDFDPNAIDSIVVVVKAKVTKATVGTTIATVTIRETGPDTRIFSGLLPAISAEDTFNDAAQQENTWLEVGYTLESTYNNVYALLLPPEKEPSYYPKDSDGDGITDDKDKCPSEAETYNGYEDTDGCYDVTGDEPATSQSGPGPAAPLPPSCIGGVSFSLAKLLPKDKCTQDRGALYYYLTFNEKKYYAYVEHVWGSDYNANYALYIIQNTVILEPTGQYKLCIYDSNRKEIGCQQNQYGTVAAIEILETTNIPTTPQPTPKPTPTPTASSEFDGSWEVTFEYYMTDYPYSSGELELYFNVENGRVTHPDGIFTGSVNSDGKVEAVYSDCVKIAGSAGEVTGYLDDEEEYGTGTFSCGDFLYGEWEAEMTDYESEFEPRVPPTPTPTPVPSPQPTGYLLYENKNYGFSIKYPSTWQKTELLERDQTEPNTINIVKFAPSQLTSYYVSITEDDTKYRGLAGQQFLDKIRQEAKDGCSSPSDPGFKCLNVEFGETGSMTHVNGYTMHYSSQAFNVSTDQGNIGMSILVSFIPDGNDVWQIGVLSFSPNELQHYLNDITSISQSFTIYDYEGALIPSPIQQPQLTQTKGSISVSTDRPSYATEDTVTVKTNLVGVGTGKNIAVSVNDPTGNNIVSRTITTDAQGSGDLQFKLQQGSESGTYQITATASVDGSNYKGSSQFTVKPWSAQVTIVSIEATDQQGNPISFFKRGSNGYVKVVLTADSSSASLTTVNLFGSDLTSLGIGSFKTTFSGESEMILSFFIPADAATGTGDIYTNVFSDWPSRGGTPLTGESSTKVRIQ